MENNNRKTVPGVSHSDGRKLIFCRDFQNGKCDRGSKCKFIHAPGTTERMIQAGAAIDADVEKEIARTHQSSKFCWQLKMGQCSRTPDRCKYYHHEDNTTQQALECPICKEEIYADELCCLPCNHILCQPCGDVQLGLALQEGNDEMQCPVCRQPGQMIVLSC